MREKGSCILRIEFSRFSQGPSRRVGGVRLASRLGGPSTASSGKRYSSKDLCSPVTSFYARSFRNRLPRRPSYRHREGSCTIKRGIMRKNGTRHHVRRLADCHSGHVPTTVGHLVPMEPCSRIYPLSPRAASTARKSAANVFGHPRRIFAAVLRARSDTTGQYMRTGWATFRREVGTFSSRSRVSASSVGNRVSAGTGSWTAAAWRRRLASAL